MPEYVYALHDFLPEHEDEVSFHAGERIEVVEKDDLYGDGWWQGRNLAGKVGLFPQSYTTSAPPTTDDPPPSIAESSSTDSAATETPPSDTPSTRTPLQALQEEPESEASTPNNNTAINILAPIPQSQSPAIFLNGHETDTETEEPPQHKRTISSGEEVMAATMTDVQQAIEQLGRRRNGSSAGQDGDEARSFSFASTRDGTDAEGTDTEYDMSDVDGPDSAGASGGVGESWHKGARTKLAEKARRAVEEAEKLEAIMSGNGFGARGVAPPIEVELSDESEDEGDGAPSGDFTSHSSIFTRHHPHIPEEEEGEEEIQQQQKAQEDNHVVVPERDEYESQTATATRASFPVFHPPPTSVSAPPATHEEQHTSTPAPVPEQVPTPLEQLVESMRNSTNNNERYRESLIALPSPTGSFPSGSAEQSKHNSVTSAATSAGTSGLSLLPLTASTFVEDDNAIKEKDEEKIEPEKEKDKLKEKTHPSEWDVNEVVEWLKTKGFDQDVCEKFTEQEITGDVLLELDVNLLKTEIGIMAFGKRMRIANAITDLRRPPSIAYSDHAPLTSTTTTTTSSIPLSPTLSHSQTSQGHSRHHSTAGYSHHSFPGSVSGVQAVGVGQIFGSGSAGAGSPLYSTNGSVMYSPEAGYFVQQQQQQQQPQPMGQQQFGHLEPPSMGVSASAPVINGNGRPAHLMLSPSDGALKASAGVIAVAGVPEEDEDRGVASESEAMGPTSMRRRIFGRSYDSASSKLDSASRHSKEGSVSLSSPGIAELSKKDSKKDKSRAGDKEREKEKDKEREDEKDRDSIGSLRPRAKRGAADGGSTGKSGSERLSIFGMGGSLHIGKGRKPPPKLSPATIEEGKAVKEKNSHSPHSMFTLPRLTSGSKSKNSNDGRPSSPSAFASKPISNPKPKSTIKEQRDPTLLRKRTSSAPAPPTDATRAANGVGGSTAGLKLGQSILEQIGEADFKGWMRKKGDRYNSWKLRYFVLKGPDLYCLRSNSLAETKIKGYVNIVGYKVTVDENVNPGRYGFRIEHDHDKTHYFSSDEKSAIRDWMKAIMKATIGRDYTKPVISSCNIPTIPLMVAQAMNPAPRPPSPTARAATQKALRRDDTTHLSTRDARVLMGLPSPEEGTEERTRLPSFFANETVASERAKSPVSIAPARPSREMRRLSTTRSILTTDDTALIEWANSHLPNSLQIRDPTTSIGGGLALLRIAESIKGKPASPPVLDSAFPQGPTDDKLDGLFQLFDFLLDNDVKMGSVSINDVRQGKRDKILQLLRALKAWEDKRRALANSIGTASSVQSGGFMAPVVWS